MPMDSQKTPTKKTKNLHNTTWIFFGFALLGQIQAESSLAQDATALSAENEQQDIKPMIDKIDVEGRVYFKEETLRSFLSSTEGQVFQEKLVKEDMVRLESEYKSRGYLRAQVTYRLENLEQNPASVANPENTSTEQNVRNMRNMRLVFVVVAGERASLHAVHIRGNRLVSDVDLRKNLFSRPPEFLGALTRAGFFHKPFVDDDAKRILATYYTFGFLESQVENTRIQASHDLDGMDIYFDVKEGPRYRVGGITFLGDVPPDLSNDELRQYMSIPDGGTADAVKLQQDADQMASYWRDLGYPFAHAEPAFGPAVDVPSDNPFGPLTPDEKAIQIFVKIVKGSPAEVRNVYARGQQNTQERVILRDLAIHTGDRYNASLLRKSEDRLRGLGYFAQVQARPIEVLGHPELVDIEVLVQEQQTWAFNIAPAVLANEGLLVVGLLSERNLFGAGLIGSASVQFSGLRQLFDVSLTEPRLFDRYMPLSVELHRRQLSYRSFQVSQHIGGSLRTSMPVVDSFPFLRVGAGVSIDVSGIVPYEGFPVDTFVDDAGESLSGILPKDILRNTVDASLILDQRDSILFPRNGFYLEGRAAYTGPLTVSSVAFAEESINGRFFWTPFFGITLKTNTSIGFLQQLSDAPIPSSERFYLGGPGSLRGYFPRTISPTLTATATEGDTAGKTFDLDIGGTARFLQNVELEFTLIPNSPIRGFVFADAGNAYANISDAFVESAVGAENVALPLGLYWSTGFGIVFETPVLPMRLEWSVPLTKRSFDRDVDFFLGIGSAF